MYKEEDFKKYLLYAVTDSRWLEGRSLVSAVEEAIDGGVTMVQVREKHCSTDAYVSAAKPIVMLCKERGIPCIINDDVQAAKLLDADGVHVGQSDMRIAEARAILGPEKLIGTSAHYAAEAIRAQEQGADYIGCGAVFGSQTKTDATVLSHAELCRIRNAVEIPMVAIGGINVENFKDLSHTGIDGVAIISAIFAQKEIKKAANYLRMMAEQICGRENL